MVNTVKVIDALLKTDLPYGPGWHRYNDDGYGEHPDGSPFDGTGVGRLWPLLAGERAHYELAAGHTDEAVRLLHVLEASAGEGKLFPEQVWDAETFPKKNSSSEGLPVRPCRWSGLMPNTLSCLRSLQDGRVFDMPPQTSERYIKAKTTTNRVSWRYNNKRLTMPAGSILRIELFAAATVHWSADNWKTIQDIETHDSGLNVFIVDLPVDTLPSNTNLIFTFHWTGNDTWEGTDFSVRII